MCLDVDGCGEDYRQSAARTLETSADAALDRRGDCCESCCRSRALRRSASPRTSSNPIPSPSAKSGFLRSMIRDCGRTIGLKTHTSRFDDERENSSGSSRLDQPNGSSRSMPPSRTPSTSNAISFLAPYSRRFGPRRSLSGGRAASQPDPGKGEFRPTAAVNVMVWTPPVTASNAP